MLLKFLDVDFFTKKLSPITSTTIITSSGKFHEQGFFSEEIFGKENTLQRRQTFSFINLNAYVIHPTALNILMRLDRNIGDFISTEEMFNVDSNGNLVKDPDGVTGITEFINIFPKIKFRGGTHDRDEFIRLLHDAYAKKLIFINKVPVIPPDLRPAYKNEETGELEMDQLNNYYLTILKRAIAIRTSGGSGPFYDTMNFYLQKSVSECTKFIETKLSKKRGLIRNQMLGKRVNFSARAVITNSPTLKPDEMGIPFKILVMLFEPFIIHALLRRDIVPADELERMVYEFSGTDASVDSLKKILNAIKNGDKVNQDLFDLVHKATEMSIRGRIVLAKRDPALQQESVRAFRPVMTETNSIQLCNLMTAGFTADFDGDQMAVFHPLSNEAQLDARKMIRAQTNKTFDGINIVFSWEVVTGLFLMTAEKAITSKPTLVTEEDLDKSLNIYAPVIYRGRTTTLGKAVFNSCFPKDFGFIDDQINKKKLDTIFVKVYNKYGFEILEEIMHKVKKFGYKFATIIAPSMILEDMLMPKSITDKIKLIDKVSVEKAFSILDSGKIEMREYLKNKGSGLFDYCESGGAKGWEQTGQTLLAKGIVTDVQGKLLPPITGSFSSGLKPSEMFNMSYGSRSGIVSRVMNTADTGYLTRQLVYLLNSVEIDWLLKDCKTTRTLPVRLTKDIIQRLKGRFIIENGKVIEFDASRYKDGDTINLRSPIYCKSHKICHTCYGRLLEKHKSPYVGIIAAQNIGERATQVSMSSHHCMHRNMLLMIKIDGKISINTFEGIWNDLFSNNSKIESDGECIYTDSLEVWDSDKWTKVKRIVRHKKDPDQKMMLLRNQRGEFVISQANHPHMLARNLGRICDNCGGIIELSSRNKNNRHCRECGQYREVNINKVGEYSETVINKFERGTYVTNSSFPIWQETHNIDTVLEPYLLGFFIAEGSVGKQKDRHSIIRPTNINIVQKDQEYLDKIKPLMQLYGNLQERKHRSGFNKDSYTTTLRVNNINLSKRLAEKTGTPCENKHIPYDFIHYTDKQLSDILCGIIDGDGYIGTTHGSGTNIVGVTCTSTILIQQLHYIFEKFGIRSVIVRKNLSKISKKFVLNITAYPKKQHRNIFKNSLKMRNFKFEDRADSKKFLDNVVGYDEVFFDDSEYLYDLTTETGTLTINGILEHNTGGAAKLSKRDIVTEVLDNDPFADASFVKSTLKQIEFELVTTKKGSLVINLDSYDEGDDMIIDEENKTVWVKSLISYFEAEEGRFNIVIDMSVTINADSILKHTNQELRIGFEAGEKLLTIPIDATDMKKAAMYVKRLLAGKELFKDVPHLMLKVFKVFAVHSNMDLVHFEVLMSQCLRDQERPILPARLGLDVEHPMLANIKKNVFNSGFIQSLGFENIGEAIRQGLTAKYELQPSILEKVLMGQIIEEKKK